MKQTGEIAPDFTLKAENGETVRLADLLGRGPVVVFFYPKDSTPGCTVEAGAFAKAYGEFRELGAEVVGVSSDDGASHQKFKEQCDLPYPLLSDEGGKVRAAFGVPKTLGLIPGRTTFVLDQTGSVRHVFNSQFKADRHAAEALTAVRELKS
jgi:peroxiredoxin Q/BCP